MTKKDKYSKRKNLFFSALALLFVIIAAYIFLNGAQSNTPNSQFVTSAICGCVKEPAVYRLPQGSDLASLIYEAKGLKPTADIRNIELGQNIQQDRVYHIPCRKEDIRHAIPEPELGDIDIQYPTQNEGLTNYLYIGFPAVYLLIQHSSEYNFINIIYIPHSTVFMNNEYRIIDFYFTLGIGPTINILRNRINQRIDYYFIQNQSSFVLMVDELDGLELNVDKQFAEEYEINQGSQILDGWHTYEYIRFIDQKRHYKAQTNTKSLEDLQLEVHNAELAFNQREQRQRNVIYALHKRFNLENTGIDDVSSMIRTIITKGTVDSNIDFQVGTDIFRLLMEGTEISYGTLPGTYQEMNGNIYYIPEGPGYELLRKNEVRKLFELNKQSNGQILY